MKQIFFTLLLSYFSVWASEEVPYLTSESDTYALVDGVVNAYNGKLVQIDQDIQMDGVDPLEMIRYYDGGHDLESKFGYGVGCSYPSLIEVRNLNTPQYVTVELRQGLEVLFKLKYCKHLETKTSGSVYAGSVAKQNYEKGYTNCPSHLIQGEPSLFALHLQIDNTSAVLTLGDGGKRHYQKVSPTFYRLYLEELPSGNKRHFFYEGSEPHEPLTNICTTNREGSLNLNWLKFSYGKKNTHVTASNGQATHYLLKRKKEDEGDFLNKPKRSIEPVLHKAFCGHNPETEYKSVKHAKSSQSAFGITQIKSAGRQLEVEYDKYEKVKTLKSSASSTPLYTFHYHSHYTDIVDASGGKKTYHFSHRRPTSLIEPHRTQNFVWDDKGQLTSITMHTPEGPKQFEQTYAYDAKGNVIETNIIGNITACGSYDTNKTQFTYDQATNHLLSIKRNDNHECLYSYIPGTRLIANKFTFFNQFRVEREFYDYDKNGILILKVIDDGSGADLDDFSHMTYRLITEIIPHLDPAQHGMTQPHFIKEFYVDIATRQIHPLKTTECIYTQGDLISEKRVIDADGNHRYTLFYEYNARRELIRERNALGELTLYAYDDAGNRIHEEKVGSGKITQFTYDLANRLIQEKELHPDRHLSKSYTYDVMGNRLTETDSYGRITHKKYDLAGREIHTLDPLGYTEEKSYDLFGNITMTKDKDGHRIKTAYNALKKPLEIVYPDNTVEWFNYDVVGNLIKEWKRDETVLQHQLDYKGRISKTDFYSKEGNHLKTLQYIYKGPHLSSEIDAMGNKTEYRIDGAGRTIEKIQGSKVIKYSYDALGRIVKTTTGDLSNICVEYDLLDRKTEERVEDLSGTIYSKVQFEYDVLGNETTRRNFVDASNYSESHTVFNAQSLPILEIDPLGHEKKISYSQTDHLEKTTTDALGRRTLEIFDPLHRLQERKTFSSTGVLLDQQNTLCDGRGNPCFLTYQIILNGTSIGSYEIKAAYDCMNQKIIEVEQDSKFTKWAYHRGKIVQLTNPDKIIISYAYDALGRLIEQTASDQTIHNRFAYDLNDNVIVAHNVLENTHVDRHYDTLNRMIYEKQGSGLEFFYSYDLLDRIKEMRFCEGSTTYEYSPTSLLSSSRYRNGELLYSTSQQCNWKGKVIEATFNQIPCTYTWDLNGRCAEIHTASYQQSLSYDPVGNLIKSTGQDAISAFSDDYAYDDLNQLTKESDTLYTYDSLNNRRSKNEIEHTLNHLNQITKTETDQYSYDTNGRRTAHNDIFYTYDALNRLISFKQGPLEIAYTYDALGRRVKRIHNDQEMHYLYQFDTEIGSITNQLTEFRLLHNRYATAALELKNEVYFPIRNHRGDIVQLLDKDGSPQTTYRYDSFGNFTSSGSIRSPWLMSGQRYDTLTTLYQFNKRDYDPALGRWLTCDPLGLADGPNLYAYVHNNPLIYIDPYGLFREESKDFLHGVSRGAADDTSWGASTIALGEFQPKGISGKLGYYAGTTASFAAGLYYGASEVKAARYITKLFQRAMHKAPTQSLKASQTIKAVSTIEKAKVSPDLAKVPEKLCPPKELPSLDTLSKAGQKMDRGGLTKAGRSLDKHGNRPDTPFPLASGNPASKNAQGQFQLDDILTNPRSAITTDFRTGDFRILSPDGRGLYYKSDGSFRGFIDK